MCEVGHNVVTHPGRGTRQPHGLSGGVRGGVGARYIGRGPIGEFDALLALDLGDHHTRAIAWFGTVRILAEGLASRP